MKTISGCLVAALAVAILGGCSDQDAGQPAMGSIAIGRARADGDPIKVSRPSKVASKRSARKNRVVAGKPRGVT
jgi:hypothetical protein